MVQWLRLRLVIQFPVSAVISDLVVVCDYSLQNMTKNTGGPLCVCTPHMQFEDPPLPLCEE